MTPVFASCRLLSPAPPAPRALMRPNYTLPLRMQAAGRPPRGPDQRWLSRRLWVRAARDPAVWRRVCASGALAGAVQFAANHAVWPVALAAAVGAGIALVVGGQTYVRAAMTKAAPLNN